MNEVRKHDATNAMSEHGYRAEDRVAEICRAMFLADFTVRSPQLEKGSGVKKEAADFLVPFGDVLVAFQVKSKRGPDETVPPEVYRARVEKTVSEGIDQLKTIKRALAAGQINGLRNEAEIDLPFKPTEVRKIVGVVVLDLPDEKNRPRELSLEIANGFEMRHGIPAHVFRMDDFEVISTELDTPADFIAYLEVRETFIGGGRCGPVLSELDLLACYKSNPDVLRDALGSGEYVVLEDGIWEAYVLDNQEAFARRAKQNAPSFLVDKAIEGLRASIGYDPDLPPSLRSTFEKIPGADAYFQIASELAMLTRVERRMVGRTWLAKMDLAESRPVSFSACAVRNGRGVLVASTNDGSRQNRVETLHALAVMAYCHLGVKRLVAIVTEPASCQNRSFDCLLIEGGFANEARLKELAREFFGEPVGLREFEFTDVETGGRS